MFSNSFFESFESKFQYLYFTEKSLHSISTNENSDFSEEKTN